MDLLFCEGGGQLPWVLVKWEEGGDGLAHPPLAKIEPGMAWGEGRAERGMGWRMSRGAPPLYLGSPLPGSAAALYPLP